MAGEGVQNMVARRVTDDLTVFSRETSPSRYIKFLLEQKIAKSHRFVERMHSEVATSRDCIAQLNVMVAEFITMENQEEVHDSWLAARDARRGEQGRLDGLNEVIDDALEEIEKLDTNMEILKGAADVVVSGCVFCCLEIGKNQLAEIAESPRLGDKMKVSLGKKRRLIGELEAAGEVDGAAKCLEHMKVVVARDAVTLRDMETVWARCQVGKSLEAGFVADIEVQK
nr:hypothetical protein [Tanacetum cinerariifolium]